MALVYKIKMCQGLKLWADKFLELLFPTLCAGCGKEGALLCADCLADIKFIKQVCLVCKQFSKHGLTHVLCSNAVNNKCPSQFLSACDYSDAVVRNIIHQFKYNYIQGFSAVCADIMAEFLAGGAIIGSINGNSHYSDKAIISAARQLPQNIMTNPKSATFSTSHLFTNYVITFVPMTKRKYNIRSFNQAALMSQMLGARMGLKPEMVLAKVKHTAPQMELDRTRRQSNLKGAFEAAGDVSGKKILIIDDVCTTGSTLSECAKTLLKAGAAEVRCLVFARD